MMKRNSVTKRRRRQVAPEIAPNERHEPDESEINNFDQERASFFRSLDVLIRESGSKNAFSEKVKIPRSTVDSWKRSGGGKGPSVDALLRIASSFDVTVDWLLFGDSRAKRSRASRDITEQAFFDELGERVAREMERSFRMLGIEVNGPSVLSDAIERERELFALRFSWLLDEHQDPGRQWTSSLAGTEEPDFRNVRRMIQRHLHEQYASPAGRRSPTETD